MHDEADLVRGWLLKADSDLKTGLLVVHGEGPFDTACFHAQQAVEKYLKALLALAGMVVPKTHDLLLLARTCQSEFPNLRFEIMELARLMPFAVQLRYDPGFWPPVEVANDALQIAQGIRNSVLAIIPQEAHPDES